MMKVFQPGSGVKLSGEIDGVVVSVLIEDSGIQYKVAWWDGNVRHCEWLSEFEVFQKHKERREIGFNTKTKVVP